MTVVVLPRVQPLDLASTASRWAWPRVPVPAALAQASSLTLSLLSVATALLVLGVLVARSHRAVVAVAVPSIVKLASTEAPAAAASASPAPAQSLRTAVCRAGWAVIDRLAALLEALEDDDEPVAVALAQRLSSSDKPSAPPRTFTLGGADYRLPSAPQSGHRRTPSISGGAPPLPELQPRSRGVPLSSPPAPKLAFSPPPAAQRFAQAQAIAAAAGPDARPLSAAKVILSRHHVRKPYRPPPVPGAPRSTPMSKLAAGA